MKLRPVALATSIAAALAACSPGQEPAPDPSGTWQVDPASSNLNFVTTKAGSISEVGTIAGLSGSIEEDGMVEIEIPMVAVDTGIDVRDGRMKEFLFDTAQFPIGTVAAQIDQATLASLAANGGGSIELEGTATIAGSSAPVTLPMTVTAVGNDRVLVQTTKPIIVEARTFGLEGGIEKLRELAGLDSITPVVPVTVSLTFIQS